MAQSGQPPCSPLGDEPASTRRLDGLVDELPAKCLLDAAQNGPLRGHDGDALVPADLRRVEVAAV